MPRLTGLPNSNDIMGLKGNIDYYTWRGIPCARTWPRWTLQQRAPAVAAQNTLYGWFSSHLNQTDELLITTAREQTKSTNWTWKDLLTFASSGNLYP